MIGRIYGRLLGSPNAFQPQSFVRPVNATVEQNYVDGISITHGHPRNHIWTLATSVSFISLLIASVIAFKTNLPLLKKTFLVRCTKIVDLMMFVILIIFGMESNVLVQVCSTGSCHIPPLMI